MAIAYINKESYIIQNPIALYSKNKFFIEAMIFFKNNLLYTLYVRYYFYLSNNTYNIFDSKELDSDSVITSNVQK
jgi:hypothetical protein